MRTLEAGRLAVTLTGTASGKARGAAARVLARGTKTVLSAGTYKVTVRLTKKARRSLLGARSLRGKLSLRFTDADGQAVTRARTVKLTRR
jgi:hypothetical protein